VKLEFLEKVPGSAPYLRDIHDFTFGATLLDDREKQFLLPGEEH
jgi:hypothetical protein